jgi:hypothetical protein
MIEAAIGLTLSKLGIALPSTVVVYLGTWPIIDALVRLASSRSVRTYSAATFFRSARLLPEYVAVAGPFRPG